MLSGALLLIAILLALYTAHSNREGFESYANCLSQGYPNEFCLQVPIQSKV